MRLKKGILFGIFASAVVFGCKDSGKNHVQITEQEPVDNSTAQTYAEIAVKSGGEWEGRQYKGGSFENVEELELPEQHTDHSGFIKYEGPGWENSQVAYRLYLDWRNAIDIFGKKTDSMILKGVGREDAPSYHEEADWGLDILKAGKSLGLGGFGRYIADSVVHFRNVEKTRTQIRNTDDFSEVVIDYSDWITGNDSIDISASFTITPEDRYTKVELSPSEPIEDLATGIVKFDDIEVQQKKSPDGKWGYIATYGKQTLVDDEDQLGMAILYNTDEVAELKEGPYDHLVIFKPEEDITYYFLAAWEQEQKGINSEEAFIADLNEKLEQLDITGEL